MEVLHSVYFNKGIGLYFQYDKTYSYKTGCKREGYTVWIGFPFGTYRMTILL